MTTMNIVITVLFSLLILSVISSCALADNYDPRPPSGQGEFFDQMKAQMTEIVNNTISSLENSKVNLTNESSKNATETLVANLKSIREELSNAETEDELFKIDHELDMLFATTPEEIKGNLNLTPKNMNQRPDMQNGNGNYSQGFIGGPGKQPEMMNNSSYNRSSPPEMMGNRSLPWDENETLNESKMRPGPGLGPGYSEKENSSNKTEENSTGKTDGLNPFGNFISTLVSAFKSLFS